MAARQVLVGASHRPRIARILGLALLLLAAIVPTGCILSAESRSPIMADTLPDAAALLAGAATSLGWSGSPTPCAELAGPCYEQTSGTDATLHATVSAAPGHDDLLDQYERHGLLRGLYRGREAIIERPGDPLCPRGEAEAALGCATATGGLIAWRYGPYILSAEDVTGAGREAQVAEALWRAAEETLGAFPGTVVILADTRDTPGGNSLRHFRTLAQSADRYYAANAYGRVDLAATFMDADGDGGDEDWYTVSGDLASYTGRERDFALAAVQAAYAGTHLPPLAYAERIIVVCPATRSPLGDTRNLFSATYRQPPAFYIEVQGAEHATRLHVASLVVISEEDQLGSWVHEIGHTLHAHDRTPQGQAMVVDRYGDGRGEVGPWDLMSTGSRWGYPEGSLPVHMSSFTKEQAGWLRYAPAAWEQTYTLTALEGQKAGDSILTLDDPASDDPRALYILEARDGQAFFGAPETGVLLYHVAPATGSSGHRVDLLPPQDGETMGQQWGVMYARPTLRGAASPQGVRQFTDPATGLRVTLLAESFSPYRATVRIERIQ